MKKAKQRVLDKDFCWFGVQEHCVMTVATFMFRDQAEDFVKKQNKLCKSKRFSITKVANSFQPEISYKD